MRLLWILLGLLGLGAVAPGAARRAGFAGALFAGGMILFSGPLYLKALGLAEITNPLTPAGGFLLMAGWLALAWAGIGSLRAK